MHEDVGCGLVQNSMDKWKTVLTAGSEELGEVNIKRAIFQGDSPSPLLFVLLHPQADVYRLCFKRSAGGRGMISIEECVNAKTR